MMKKAHGKEPHAVQELEFALLDLIQTYLKTDWLDTLVPAFTHLCDHGELWIALAVVLLLFRRTRPFGAAVALALVFDLVTCNWIMKPLFHRVRPYDVNTAVQLLVPRLGDFSFPSGHTACSFAAAGALRHSGSRWWWAALVVAVLMGLSRLYLYVHWPSDVLAGAIVGWLCGMAAAYLVKRKTSR